ncbi:MAG: hypothetical protein Q7S25_02195, partial [Candidatus Limnocylindria bacterium]|nr:hypothetical protein [Candidatus Limnocylindria bacterium]
MSALAADGFDTDKQKDPARIDRWLAALSLEEKCAQLLVARPAGDAFDPRDAAAEIGVGGYIVHSG